MTPNQAVLFSSEKVMYLKDPVSSKSPAKIKVLKKNHLPFKYLALCINTLLIFRVSGFTRAFLVMNIFFFSKENIRIILMDTSESQ